MKVLYTNEKNIVDMENGKNFIACENEFIAFKIPILIDGEPTNRNDLTITNDFKVFEVSPDNEPKKADYDSLLSYLN